MVQITDHRMPVTSWSSLLGRWTNGELWLEIRLGCCWRHGGLLILTAKKSAVKRTSDAFSCRPAALGALGNIIMAFLFQFVASTAGLVVFSVLIRQPVLSHRQCLQSRSA